MSDTIQSAEELAERIMLDNIDFEDETFDIRGAADYIKSDRLALISDIRADEASKQSERYAACVEALKRILETHGPGTLLQAEHLQATKALADLEAPK
jgi:3-phosphoglycerate kinase